MKTIIEKIIHQDILSELLKHKNDYNISDKEYTEFCNTRIDVYIKQIELR